MNSHQWPKRVALPIFFLFVLIVMCTVELAITWGSSRKLEVPFWYLIPTVPLLFSLLTYPIFKRIFVTEVSEREWRCHNFLLWKCYISKDDILSVTKVLTANKDFYIISDNRGRKLLACLASNDFNGITHLLKE